MTKPIATKPSTTKPSRTADRGAEGLAPASSASAEPGDRDLGRDLDRIWIRSPFPNLVGDWLFERFAVIALSIAAFLPYLVINAVTASWPARDLTIAIDWQIPFDPRWQLVYLGIYLVAFVPTVQLRQAGLMRRAALALLIVEWTSFVFFLAMPVGIERYESVIDLHRSFPEWFLALNYAWDEPRNLFPSLHVGNAFLVAFETNRVDRRVGVVFGLMASLIAYSTVVLKHHAIADVVAGVALAYVVYRLVFRPYVPSDATDEVLLPRRWMFLLPGLYVAALALFYLGYSLGWQPFSWPLH